MVAGLLHIVCHFILKGKHAFCVHVPRAGDQVFLIGILRSQLIADKVTAVIEISPVHLLIFHGLPPGRFHLADALPLSLRHGLLSYAGLCFLTSSQSIQLTVGLVGFLCQLFLCKVRLTVFHFHIRVSAANSSSVTETVPTDGAVRDSVP